MGSEVSLWGEIKISVEALESWRSAQVDAAANLDWPRDGFFAGRLAPTTVANVLARLSAADWVDLEIASGKLRLYGRLDRSSFIDLHLALAAALRAAAPLGASGTVLFLGPDFGYRLKLGRKKSTLEALGEGDIADLHDSKGAKQVERREAVQRQVEGHDVELGTELHGLFEDVLGALEEYGPDAVQAAAAEITWSTPEGPMVSAGQLFVDGTDLLAALRSGTARITDHSRPAFHAHALTLLARMPGALPRAVHLAFAILGASDVSPTGLHLRAAAAGVLGRNLTLAAAEGDVVGVFIDALAPQPAHAGPGVNHTLRPAVAAAMASLPPGPEIDQRLIAAYGALPDSPALDEWAGREGAAARHALVDLLRARKCEEAVPLLAARGELDAVFAIGTEAGLSACLSHLTDRHVPNAAIGAVFRLHGPERAWDWLAELFRPDDPVPGGRVIAVLVHRPEGYDLPTPARLVAIDPRWVGLAASLLPSRLVAPDALRFLLMAGTDDALAHAEHVFENYSAREAAEMIYYTREPVGVGLLERRLQKSTTVAATRALTQAIGWLRALHP
jgi:hypothetical protein